MESYTTALICWVADRTNARIQRFDLDGKYVDQWNNLARPFALKMSGGSLWIAGMTLANPAKPQILEVNPANGKNLAQGDAPGPHSIDVTDSGDIFAGGCCGGIKGTGFYWLRPASK